MQVEVGRKFSRYAGISELLALGGRNLWGGVCESGQPELGFPEPWVAGIRVRNGRLAASRWSLLFEVGCGDQRFDLQIPSARIYCPALGHDLRDLCLRRRLQAASVGHMRDFHLAGR